MPGRYVFDLEADGLLPELTKIHCLGIYDLDSGEHFSFGPTEVERGVDMLAQADLIIGHNIIGYDLQAIKKVYPSFSTKALVRDTLVCSRLMWPHIRDLDFNNELHPRNLIGAQSLEAWGHRLGYQKGDFKGPWDVWSQEMQNYMDLDVRVTVKLWAKIVREAEQWGVPLLDPNPPPKKDCIELEHRVAWACEDITRHGFRFNTGKAATLVGQLTACKQQLSEELSKTFEPEVVKTPFVPQVNNKARGYVKGQMTIKEKVVPFNPGSRQQVGKRLIGLGWKPVEYTQDGSPKVDDEILQKLPYPQAKVLAEYYTVDKRLGQIANGNEAWLRHERNGRIHGRIVSNGAHTGRMTHKSPNMAQVPGNHAPYGEQCRDCFEADEGHVLVGCDADALELRDLAGYMAVFDGGAYIETVLRGDKAKGTDMHTINAKLIGCSRDVAKVFFYALIYGAGDAKLGAILGKGAKEGRAARERLMRGLPALGKIVELVYLKVEKRGYLIGLDGRRLSARQKNAALNTLLQSAGAVQMKRGLVILLDKLNEKGWRFGEDYALVGLIHDEWQATVKPELAKEFGEIAAQSIRDAGTYYSFGCPLDGQYQIGKSWKETH